MSDDKTSSDLRAQGDKIRREVLGDARVDSTTRDPDAFNAPLIDYLTKYLFFVENSMFGEQPMFDGKSVFFGEKKSTRPP